MDVRTGLRAAAMVLLLAGWAVLMRGLYLSPASSDPALDLDAGSSFALDLDVYLPAVALTAVLLVAVPVTLTLRAGSVVGAIAALTAGVFAAWVFRHDDLLAYLPGLTDALRLTAGLSLGAVLLLVVEATTAGVRPPSPGEPSVG